MKCQKHDKVSKAFHFYFMYTLHIMHTGQKKTLCEWLNENTLNETFFFFETETLSLHIPAIINLVILSFAHFYDRYKA